MCNLCSRFNLKT